MFSATLLRVVRCCSAVVMVCLATRAQLAAQSQPELGPAIQATRIVCLQEGWGTASSRSISNSGRAIGIRKRTLVRSMKVYAFGEEGQAPQAPGPLIRVSEGTEIHVTIHNLLPTTAGVHGLHQHPGDAKAVLEVPSQETREMRFAAGAAGTYQYYASAGGNFFPRGYRQPTQHSRQIRTTVKKAEDKKPGGWSTNLTLSD